MKTAVSIPDPLYAAADRLARRKKMTRSGLYARALEAFLAEHRGDEVRAQLDRVYTAEDSGLDPVLGALQADALREDW